MVDLAVLLGDGVGVGRRQQVLGGAGHPVLTLVLGAQVGGGRKDPAVTAEGAVIRGHFLSHCAPGNNWVLLTASKETKEKQVSKEIRGLINEGSTLVSWSLFRLSGNGDVPPRRLQPHHTLSMQNSLFPFLLVPLNSCLFHHHYFIPTHKIDNSVLAKLTKFLFTYCSIYKLYTVCNIFAICTCM